MKETIRTPKLSPDLISELKTKQNKTNKKMNLIGFLDFKSSQMKKI